MIIVYIIAGIFVILLLITAIAPKNYHVSRNIQIKRPLPEVFNYLKYLRNQSEWSPWEQRDPEMFKEIRGTDGTVGAISYWKGNKEVGEGEQEITRIVENDIIESQLRFLRPFASISESYLKVVSVTPENTRVSWGFSGNHKLPMRIMMFFMSMDKMVGKDFEQGLAKLKKVLENNG
ncbi:polyketide cyclase [Robertkochia solimangrovi]|nr:polyketide cyclase [Robertkochia solimangrovi]